MKVKSLELINFRNMQASIINFTNRQFTVLIGDNGSGKTSIIEAITKGFVPLIRTINPEKNTIDAVGLNDIDRVMVPRMQEWEKIKQQLEQILEDLQEEGYKSKYLKRFETIMNDCTMRNSYSAVKATNMINDEVYYKIKTILQKQGVWSCKFIQIELDIKSIAMDLV